MRTKRVLADRIHELIVDMRRQWVALDERIKAFDTEFATAAKAQDGAKRLLSIPGIGALNATALVAAVGDAGTFARGRDLAAWLGLVPRQVTTGGRPKLLGITKRGSKYLRKMLIQGVSVASGMSGIGSGRHVRILVRRVACCRRFGWHGSPMQSGCIDRRS